MKNRISMQRGWIFSSAIIVMAAGCGGGGSSGPFDGGDGIDRSGLTSGAITGFGSVIVNGIKYESGTATITVNGQSANETSLRVGQIVVVRGQLDDNNLTGTADEIDSDPNLVGPISLIDIASNTFVVLGQTVQIDNDTVLMPETLSAYTVGSFVEVYGFLTGNQQLIATRVDEISTTEYEVSGVLADLDTQNMTFNLLTQAVDFSAAELVDFDNTAIGNGQMVEVEGTTFGNGGQLVVDRVTKLPEQFFNSEDEGLETEIEGRVTRFVSATDFDVGSVQVTTDNNTVFERGVITDIALDIKLEVEGTVNSQGAILAEEIEFEAESEAEMSSFVNAIDVAAGSLTVFQQVITTDSKTQFIDEGPEQLQQFSLSNLSVDDLVELKLGSGSPLLATRVERVSNISNAEIEGVVESVASPAFTILGVLITNISGNNTFIEQLSVGDFVEVEGTDNGDGTMTISLD